MFKQLRYIDHKTRNEHYHEYLPMGGVQLVATMAFVDGGFAVAIQYTVTMRVVARVTWMYHMKCTSNRRYDFLADEQQRNF